MRKKYAMVALVTIAFGALAPGPLFAHHGSAAFDSGKTLTLKGSVKEWLYSNPHCLLKLDVKDENGKVVPWIAETQAPAVMYPSGYRKDSFKPGDEVTVTVEPVKSGQPFGRIRQVTLANGTKLNGIGGDLPGTGAGTPEAPK